MKKKLGNIFIACYVMAVVFLATACNDQLDIQQSYDFTMETMPVQSKIKVGETAEIRCELKREGRFEDATYTIRYFQPDGTGKLVMDNGTVFLPNDRYPLTKETFQLYYTSSSTDQQKIDVYVEDNLGKMYQLSFSFNNDSSGEETE